MPTEDALRRAMKDRTEERPANDLVRIVGGRMRLPGHVHHLPDLLDLSPEQVLQRFRRGQIEDFTTVVTGLEEPGSPLRRLFEDLRDVAGPDNAFARCPVFTPGGLETLFYDLHGHVMEHPVWRHPFFVRFFEGRFTDAELRRFTTHYFNQVKNTRQCVALAVARFNGLMGLPYGVIAERISELTQVVLAQLVADEYGVGVATVEDYPSLDSLFRSTTHMALYRRMLDALGVPLAEQDIPMLPEVADNVLVQRLVAGHEAFTPLEALASVGLGMEWGVPEFFSLLLGGIVRWAHRERVPLTAHDLDILIAHVKYDVLHAVSVMSATALHVQDREDVRRVKNAVNMLMSARYAMMSGLYRAVFGEGCADIHDIGLAPRYHVADRRLAALLPAARRAAAPGTVEGGEAWQASDAVPLVFTED